MNRSLQGFGSLPVVRAFRPLYRVLVRWYQNVRGVHEHRRLSARWRLRVSQATTRISSLSLSDVPIVVINLPERSDRLEHFESEMKSLGVSHFRVVPGVSGRDLYPELPGDFSGAIGCNLAHSNAIEANDWAQQELLMICEDDIEFLCSASDIETLISEFQSDPNLDVLCLAGRVRGPRIPISDNLSVASGIVGQACYVVKPKMVEVLAGLWRSGVRDLQQLRLRGKNDIAWLRVQRQEAFFAFPTRRIARQRASFSDIQGRMMPPQESN